MLYGDQRSFGISIDNLKKLQSVEPEDVEQREEFFRKLNANKKYAVQIKGGMSHTKFGISGHQLRCRNKEEKFLFACEEVVRRFANKCWSHDRSLRPRSLRSKIAPYTTDAPAR